MKILILFSYYYNKVYYYISAESKFSELNTLNLVLFYTYFPILAYYYFNVVISLRNLLN